MSRRSRGLPIASLAPPAAALGGWQRLGEPFHGAGLLSMLTVGVLAGVIVPGILVSLQALPLALIPVRVRIWWRKGKEDRPHIPLWLRRAVYAADRHRCCWCGSPAALQLDHIRPWSRGGLTVLWNMMTLCGPCNRVKSNYWVARDGYVFYRPFQGSGNKPLAAQILRHERWHRWSLARWVRVGFALAA